MEKAIKESQEGVSSLDKGRSTSQLENVGIWKQWKHKMEMVKLLYKRTLE